MLKNLIVRRLKNRIINTDYKCLFTILWKEYPKKIYYRHIKEKIDIKTNYYLFREGIENLIYYFKVIWNDKDFDHVFFLQLLKAKLVRMEKYFRRENAITENSNIRADEIKEVILIIDRLLNNNYLNNELIDIELKYGKFAMDFKLLPNGNSQAIFDYRGTKTKEEKEQALYEHHLAHKRAELKENKDYQRLFSLIHKNLRKWWD